MSTEQETAQAINDMLVRKALDNLCARLGDTWIEDDIPCLVEDLYANPD